MNISFGRKDLKSLLTIEKAARKKWGVRCRKIARMYKILEAADSLADVLPVRSARLHELQAGMKGKWSVSATTALRIVFVPAHDPVPKKPDGSLDLNHVTDIKIVHVGDYH